MKANRKILALLLAAALLAGCGGMEMRPADQQEGLSQRQEQESHLIRPAEGMSPVTGLPAVYPGERPAAVMLYNNKACRPQWGLDSAGLLIEANTEGQQSRLMAVFESTNALIKAGPVTSAKDVFLQMVLPFRPLPMFIGADVYSENLLNTYKLQPLDGRYIGVTGFDFDYDRQGVYPSEYGWYTRKELMPGALGQYGMSVEAESPSYFRFDEAFQADNQNGQLLEIGYGTERVLLLEYDGSRYVMKEAGDFQWDGNDLSHPVSVDNVVLLMARPGFKANGRDREYDLSKGEGLYLCRGSAMHIHWEKGSAGEPLRLFDEREKEIGILPGKTYLGIWGGFAGQSLRLLDSNGVDQPLPALPVPLPTPEPGAWATPGELLPGAATPGELAP